jgi:hypothetical protein
LAKAVLHCTSRIFEETIDANSLRDVLFDQHVPIFMGGALLRRGREGGYAQSRSILAKTGMLFVDLTIAIDAKDCDISVGGIGTKRDAYLGRPTAATLASEERQRRLSLISSWRMGRANVIQQKASPSRRALSYVFCKFGVFRPSVRIAPRFR